MGERRQRNNRVVCKLKNIETDRIIAATCHYFVTTLFQLTYKDQLKTYTPRGVRNASRIF